LLVLRFPHTNKKNKNKKKQKKTKQNKTKQNQANTQSKPKTPQFNRSIVESATVALNSNNRSPCIVSFCWKKRKPYSE